jgi:hypothetical protein
MLERIEESPVRDGRWRADLWLVERDLERLQRDTVKMMVRLTTARLNRGAVWSLETGAGERASALIQTCDAIDRRLETARALGRPVSL